MNDGPLEREPVLIILGGLAAVLSTVLVATNAIGWTHLDALGLAAVIGSVGSICALVAAAIRGQVYSVATHHTDVARALLEPSPALLIPEDPPPVDFDELEE